jgi:alpha-D-xyloside xylohydrolase
MRIATPVFRATLLCVALGLSVLAASAKQERAFQRIHNGVQLLAGGQNVKVQFYSAGTIRVLKWPIGGSAKKASLAVIQTEVPELHIGISKSGNVITLSSSLVKLQLSMLDGTVRYFSSDNRPVLQEQRKADFAAAEIEKGAYSVQQNFTLSPDEGVYGLGQTQTGYMNFRGKTMKLVEANRNAVTPVFVSTAGYGIFWDNYSKTIFDDKPGVTSLWSEVADNVDYYFFFGPSMDQSIAGYRALTGEAPLYGKWAYGYWQSKEHYATRDELLKVAREFRDRKIPIDNLIQDWDYWGDNSTWGGMYFDESKYARPTEMLDLLHRQNFHVMISIWPGFGPAAPIYKDMDSQGFLFPTVGWAGFKFYDPYNPAATDLYWKYANEGLFSKGIDAWWMDSTEPDMVNALTPDSEEYEMKRVRDNHLGSFARYLNTYPLMTTEALYKNQRKATDRKRVYILSRSTFAGQQRAAATTWSGDIGASWDIFAKQIPAGINHSMAGIPYWTFDIGAFFTGAQGGVFRSGGKDPAYQELYTRMFQFGAFNPIFRSHGTDVPREPWEFGEYTRALVAADNLRYRLLPYIYSLGWQVTHNGYSIMRGLPMDFGQDRQTYSIADQFMFGPSIMVSPVTQYMYHRPPESSVLMPTAVLETSYGKPGLAARYYCDEEYRKLCHAAMEPNINLDWYTGWPSFITDPKFSMRWEGKLLPKTTGQYSFDIKAFGPKRVFIDGKLLALSYTNVDSETVRVDLQAGKEYNFAFETSNGVLGAFRAQLYWKTPEIYSKEAANENRERTRNVYLPAASQWIDFWTGESQSGGKSVVADAPIDKIPLMVKAGSIVPLGPFLQYSTEKPADPIELRVYPGADGSFTLYEDENDNYNYEQGVYSTIVIHWDDAKQQLKIDARRGNFPGMLQARTFQVVVVRKGHGAGLEPEAHPDLLVTYQGEAQILQLPH